jgi:hypothetical protein
VLGGCIGSIQLATYAEPADEVVTEARPGSFHGSFLSSSTTKLPQPTTFLDPGMRELRDLGSLLVDLLRLIGFHLGLEGSCLGRFLQACDGPSPVGRRLLRGALITTSRAVQFSLRVNSARAIELFPSNRWYARNSKVACRILLTRRQAQLNT